MNGRFLGFAVCFAGLLSLSGPAQDLDPSRVAAWPGYVRDRAGAVAVAGNQVFVAAGTLLAVDVSDPQHPKVARTYPGLANVGDVVVSDRRACVWDTSLGLQVLDLENPGDVPIPVPGYGPNQPRPESMALAGTLLLAAIPMSGLHLLDLRDAHQPRRVALLAMRHPSQVVVSQAMAYVVERLPRSPQGWGRLHVVDLHNPTSPSLLAYLDTPGVPTHLATADGWVCLSVPEIGLRLIDVSVPANPTQVGTYTLDGSAGGPVAMAASTAYLVRHESVEILDLRDPTTPRKIAEADLGVWAEHLALSEGYLYLGSWGSGLGILDVRQPNQPVPAGTLQTRASVEAMTLSGNHVFLAENPSGLQVLDLTNPVQPKAVAQVPTSRPLTELATLGASFLCGLETYSDTAGLDRGALAVIDITDPLQPRRRGGLDFVALPTGLAVSDSHAYAAYWHWDDQLKEERGWLEVVDCSNPDHPRAVGTYNTPGRTAGICRSGRLMLLTGLVEDPRSGSWGKIEVLDIGDPKHPRVVGTYRTRGEPSQVTVAGIHAYVSGRDWDDGTGGSETLLILDIGDPTRPIRTGGYSGGIWGRRIAVRDGVAYLADQGWKGFLDILDIRQPEAPIRRGGHALSGVARGMAFAGPLLLVASGDFHSPWFSYRGEGLLVMDALRPATLRPVGHLETASEVAQVSASGPHAFATLTSNLVAVVEIDPASQPRQVGIHPTDFNPTAVTLSGDLAYVLEAPPIGGGESGGFSVLNISDPSHPRVLGQYTGRRLQRLTLSGPYGYGFGDGYTVSGGASYPWSRLSVFDLGDPTHPRLVGDYRTNQNCSALAVAGTTVYLARPGSGLDVMDVADPARPKLSGRYARDGTIRAMISTDRYAYVASDTYGTPVGAHGIRLEVLDLANPPDPQRVGDVEFPGSVMEMTLSGPFAYVLAERTGVHVIDISDVAHPTRVGGNSALQAQSLAAGGKVLIAAGPGGLTLLDPFASLRLGISGPTADGRVHLRCTGIKGQRLRIQRTGNLVDWEDWRTLVLDEETAEVTDDVPSGLRTFYRAQGSP